MKEDVVALIVKAPRDPASPVAGMGTEALTFAAIGAAAVVWGGNVIRGKLKEDSAERVELRKLLPIVADLQVKVAACEAHRQHDTENMRRMSAELAEVREAQAARLRKEQS